MFVTSGLLRRFEILGFDDVDFLRRGYSMEVEDLDRYRTLCEPIVRPDAIGIVRAGLRIQQSSNVAKKIAFGFIALNLFFVASTVENF